MMFSLNFLLASILYVSIDSITLRKEIRNMTQEEFGDYMDAIWIYKLEGRKDGRDYMVKYDDAVAQHGIATMNSTVDQAHEYAAFSVWHSIMIREFEIALQSINPNVSVPYWDWTVGDDPDADPYHSVIFSDDYFGDSAGIDQNYVVNNSRMAYFPINNNPLNLTGVWWESPFGYLRDPGSMNPSPYVCRDRSKTQSLPTGKDFNNCLNQQNYSSFWGCTWGVPGSMKDQSKIHAGVHEWAGGSWYNETYDANIQGDVLQFDTSPNDPLWWSHHAQLDRLHYFWFKYFGESLATGDDPCGGYYGGLTVYPQPPGHNLWDHFSPPFYAYRTNEEMETLGPLNISDACYFLNPIRCNYTYPEFTNLVNDDYYGYYVDDDGERVPTETPTEKPTEKRRPTSKPTDNPRPSAKPTAKPNSNHHSSKRSATAILESITERASSLSSYVTTTSHKWRTTLISAGVGAGLGLVVAVFTAFSMNRQPLHDDNATRLGRPQQGGSGIVYDALPTEDDGDGV